jgi:hypothetical protein
MNSNRMKRDKSVWLDGASTVGRNTSRSTGGLHAAYISSRWVFRRGGWNGQRRLLVERNAAGRGLGGRLILRAFPINLGDEGDRCFHCSRVLV